MQPILGGKLNLIGYTKNESRDMSYIYDKNMKVLGFYNAVSNQTLDMNSKLVGTGNLLMTLLRP